MMSASTRRGSLSSITSQISSFYSTFPWLTVLCPLNSSGKQSGQEATTWGNTHGKEQVQEQVLRVVHIAASI